MADMQYMLERSLERLPRATKALGGLPNPPELVKTVLTATCMLLGYPEDTGWMKISKLCRRRGGAELTDLCRRCDLGNLSLETLRRVRQLMDDVSEERIANVCPEAGVISIWCKIMVAGPDV